MQSTFLNDLAERFISNHGDSPELCCIVFPNRRASVFFRKALYNLNPRVQWLPGLITLQDFINDSTKDRVIDSTEAAFHLYELYKSLEKEHAEDFETYNQWAGHVLQDFEEIDLYLVDARKLYSSVDAAYAIKHWSPETGNLSHLQDQYLHLWSQMGKWYELLRSDLRNKGLSTRAMAYRYLAEHTELIKTNYSYYIFAGFHAQNESENKIIQSLIKAGKAELIRDYDQFYIDNQQHEAGHFARKVIQEGSGRLPDFTGDYLRQTERTIKITGVAKNIGQTLVAGEVLKELIASGEDMSHTALVLCDENLLMPMLEVLPEEIGAVNISMTYPLHLLPVSSLFLNILDLQKQGLVSSENMSFYFKDIIRLIRNPVFATLIDQSNASRILEIIDEDRDFFILPEIILPYLPEHPAMINLFTNWEKDSKKALKHLISFGEYLLNRIENEENLIENFESDTTVEILKIVRKIEVLYNSFGETGNLKTLHSLFKKSLKQAGFPFVGEPLQGLQIMGLLETRNLDFKNVIFLSVNENILPNAKSTNSFIPMDIARGFGLPTYRDRDSVSAYHFYRSLHRTEQVWLIYNTEADEFGKGEKSRYISQIEEEFLPTKTKIKKGIFIPEMPQMRDTVIEIEKTSQFLEQFLERYGESSEGSGLSPTALSSFLDCSLKFYLSYFSGVAIPDEREEDIGADELGTMTHDILENLFKPYKGEVMTIEIKQKMLDKLDDVAEMSFHKSNSRRNFDEGPALLIKYGILSSIRNFLKYDDNSKEPDSPNGRVVKTIELEKKLNRFIEITIGSEKHKIKLGGKVDRIDLIEVGGKKELRIIDYKTGLLKSSDLKFNSYAEIIENKQNKILQLLMYEFMGRIYYHADLYNPGIISLRSPSLGLRSLETSENGVINEKDTEGFFISLVERITNSNTRFMMTDDLGVCENCSFRGVCNR